MSLRAALVVAASGGDAALWSELSGALDRPLPPDVRRRIVTALGSFGDPARLSTVPCRWGLEPRGRGPTVYVRGCAGAGVAAGRPPPAYPGPAPSVLR